MLGTLEARPAPDHSRLLIWACAGVALLVHLLTNQSYGYFRDELYFIACARHLAFGYVDLPPLSMLLLRLEMIVFGDSLFALRLFSALVSAGTIALTGALARELGGRTWGVALGCIAALTSLYFLAIGNFYTPQVYEPLFWTGAIYFVVRIINGAPGRTWIWFGVMVGLGLENKHSMAFFAAAIVIGILFTPERRRFREKWIWLAGLVAFLIALPNLLWQIQHGWPTWVLLRGIAQSNKNVVLTPLQYVAQQFTLMNPATALLWLGGLIWSLFAGSGRRYRLIGLAYLIALAEFIVMHGKNYYLGPAYPMLFAAGGVAVERVLALRLRWLQPVFALAMLVSAAVLSPVALPILPPEKLLSYMRTLHFEVPKTETSFTAALPQLFADQFGWKEMARSVARVYASLSPEEQKRVGIFCQDYGQAGAIDFFGSKYGLPPALSGHQNYFYWGPGDCTGEIMIVLDDDATDERAQFRLVEDRGPIETSPWAMPWEQRQHIYVCRDLKGGLRALWPRLRKWL
jgi:4-amino-4-deoxy-L-arabinose transferase-like glycosyltransferase